MSTVRLITSQLLAECIGHIGEADTVYLLISFVMESGVRLLAPHLREAVARGADVKVLTGDYLFVTEPEGLAELRGIHSDIEIRLWNSRGISFHPKAYLFRKNDGSDVLIVGSSNLSRSALTTGVEWNVSVSAPVREIAIDEAEDRFLQMFYGEQTVPVNLVSIGEYQRAYEEYHRQHPNLTQAWSEAEALETMFETADPNTGQWIRDEVAPYTAPFAPRPAQLEALHQLSVTREEGYDKALVVMATGLGKTFLAALFAKDYERVLFIAHREEILHQAEGAFRAISPNKSSGLFTGRQKDRDVDVLFASIFTLGQKRHRSRFARHHFDLIVVDEFHHAAAATYEAAIDWFQPAFLLGITATPDRADGREIYGLCDRNVAYRMEFLEAIQRGWLAPFHYIGVYDETDYSQIRWLGSKYDEQELLAAQTRDSMARLALDAWNRHAQSRGIAFCSSVTQAMFLARYFQIHGVSAECLHGGSPHTRRGEAIRKLGDGELDIIFTVDLFNEGVDIPAVDTLLFVRPTESLTVFTQQIGRGLRTHPGKARCTIIDLIGNYRNADLKLSLFHMAEAIEGFPRSRTWTIPPRVPEGCTIDLDLQVIDLVEAMREKKQPRKDRLREAYFELKRELGRRPSYEEMHLHGRVDSRDIRQEFASFVAFLAAMDELDEIELDAFHSCGPWLREVESTGMTKAYKMVVLLAMLERGQWDWYRPVSAIEIAPFFHGYYMEKAYRQRIDWNDRKTADLVQYDPSKITRLIAEMPMSKWAGSSRGMARFDGSAFWFELDVRESARTQLFLWTREVCHYRLRSYFERKGQGSVG